MYETLMNLIEQAQDDPAAVGILLDFLKENANSWRHADATLAAAKKQMQELREKAALTIQVDAPRGMIRHGERFSLRVDLSADPFEYAFFQSGQWSVSEYGRHISRELSQKVEHALVDFISKRRDGLLVV